MTFRLDVILRMWHRGYFEPNRSPHAYESPWEEGVACQRFFPSRAGSRWFQVNSQTQLQRDVLKKVHTDSFQSRVAPQETRPGLMFSSECGGRT
ncbi:uncharacterized protein BKA55DRAFT_582150 [Fusarium redolens]|uniref:Uncharacterized protein n=1 Tax=Fusarium redolens TaxID=48865 RepID=A0A9P9JS59_FUSRE|nr:uncharacterized protein BKA55DRAFT_582150 [Fusarium redolens]KAH7231296.1 hypothetical protein BKA55DRAFT_582150 [Fusarium redolens]